MREAGTSSPPHELVRPHFHGVPRGRRTRCDLGGDLHEGIATDGEPGRRIEDHVPQFVGNGRAQQVFREVEPGAVDRNEHMERCGVMVLGDAQYLLVPRVPDVMVEVPDGAVADPVHLEPPCPFLNSG
jgi:hypothetical protein